MIMMLIEKTGLYIPFGGNKEMIGWVNNCETESSDKFLSPNCKINSNMNQTRSTHLIGPLIYFYIQHVNQVQQSDN
jgi:hypothetical protein